MLGFDEDTPYQESEFAVGGSHVAFLKEIADTTGTNKYLVIQIHYFARYTQYSLDIESDEDIRHTKVSFGQRSDKTIHYMKSPWGRNSHKCYMSLSNNGRFLAVSWLSNPQVASTTTCSPPSCSVYDLSTVAKDKESTDFQFSPTPAMRIIEFQGACVFTSQNRLVLLNKDMMDIYTIETHKRKIEFQYSVDFRIQGGNLVLSTCDYYSMSYSLFTAKNKEQDVVLSATNQISAMRAEDEEEEEEQGTFDDIFYDSEEDFDDFEEEDEDDDDERTLNGDAVDGPRRACVDVEDIIVESKRDLEIFHQHQDVIKRNISLLKESNVVSVFGRDDLLILWCLDGKKVLFAKQNFLNRASDQLVVALAKEKHLVAVSSRLPHVYGDPVVKLLDAASGITVGNLILPKIRMVLGVLQVHFLQNDLYVLVITYNNHSCLFDLFEVAHGTHLDSCSVPLKDPSNVLKCQFVLCPRYVPLQQGGGFFFEVHNNSNRELTPSKKKEASTSMIDSINYVGGKVEIRQVHFFDEVFDRVSKSLTQQRLLVHKRNQLWDLRKLGTIQGAHALYPRVNRSRSEEEDKEESHIAYFLDGAETYLMSISKLEKHSSYVIHTIWKVQQIQTSSQASYRAINLQSIVYTYPYMTSQTVSNPSLNYLSTLYNLHHLKYVERIKPAIITPVNANSTPLLIIKINDLCDKVDYGTVTDFPGHQVHSDILIIPLHSHGLVECHLNAIATQHESEFSFPQIQQHVAQVPRRLVCPPSMRASKRDLEKMILEPVEFFSTLSGYMTLCRLARSDANHAFVKKILETCDTGIIYCTLIKNDEGKLLRTDALKEAIEGDAVSNVNLILRHLKDSVAKRGLECASLLLKHHQDLVEKAYI